MAWTHHTTFRVFWLLHWGCRGCCGFHTTWQGVTHCKITQVKLDMGMMQSKQSEWFVRWFASFSMANSIFSTFNPQGTSLSWGCHLFGRQTCSLHIHTHRPALMTMSTKVWLNARGSSHFGEGCSHQDFCGRSLITDHWKQDWLIQITDWKDVTSLYCHL